MIVKDIIRYLTEAGFNAFAERPEEPPEEYLIVTLLSGGEKDKLMRAHVAIQSYAGSLFDTMQLDEQMRGAMEGFLATSDVSSCKLENYYNYTLAGMKQYRYQSVYDIHFFK